MQSQRCLASVGVHLLLPMMLEDMFAETESGPAQRIQRKWKNGIEREDANFESL